MNCKKTLLGVSAATFLLVPVASSAGDLVYNPIIPSFGANPDYWTPLIGQAQIQNQHAESNSGGGGGGAPEINFPPIVIDLGGIGGVPDTPDSPDASKDETALADDSALSD